MRGDYVQRSFISMACGVSRRAYFDGFQIVALSFIAEFSFPLCCFVFDINKFRTTCQLIIYKTVGSNVSGFFFHFSSIALLNHMGDISQVFWNMYMHHFANIC